MINVIKSVGAIISMFMIYVFVYLVDENERK